MDSVAIEGRNLNFSFTARQTKDVQALRDCSLRIPSGQFWMLLGPNGCGKSTLLKVNIEATLLTGVIRIKNSDVTVGFTCRFWPVY